MRYSNSWNFFLRNLSTWEGGDHQDLATVKAGCLMHTVLYTSLCSCVSRCSSASICEHLTAGPSRSWAPLWSSWCYYGDANCFIIRRSGHPWEDSWPPELRLSCSHKKPRHDPRPSKGKEATAQPVLLDPVESGFPRRGWRRRPPAGSLCKASVHLGHKRVWLYFKRKEGRKKIPTWWTHPPHLTPCNIILLNF